MQPPTWRPGMVDLKQANAARVYDYILGGAHNFAVDRELARAAFELHPAIREIVHSSRAFLRRAVQFCLTEGVRQFVDLGSGLPTAGNVHQVAQQVDPAARVVYVDIDAATVAHARAMLTDQANVEVVHADAAEVDQVLHGAATIRLLDFQQPIAVCAVGILEYLRRSQPVDMLAKYRSLLPRGSFLVLSHFVDDFPRRDEFTEVNELAADRGWPAYWRSRTEIAEMFTGTELVDPGLVPLSNWRPDGAEAGDRHGIAGASVAGVGRLE